MNRNVAGLGAQLLHQKASCGLTAFWKVNEKQKWCDYLEATAISKKVTSPNEASQIMVSLWSCPRAKSIAWHHALYITLTLHKTRAKREIKHIDPVIQNGALTMRDMSGWAKGHWLKYPFKLSVVVIIVFFTPTNEWLLLYLLLF